MALVASDRYSPFVAVSNQTSSICLSDSPHAHVLCPRACSKAGGAYSFIASSPAEESIAIFLCCLTTYSLTLNYFETTAYPSRTNIAEENLN